MGDSESWTKKPRRVLLATALCVILLGAAHGARIQASANWARVGFGAVAGAFMGLTIVLGMRYASLTRASRPPSGS